MHVILLMCFFFGGGRVSEPHKSPPLKLLPVSSELNDDHAVADEWMKEKLDITYTFSLPEAKTFTEAKGGESREIRRRLNHFTSGRRQALSNVTSLLTHQLDFYPVHGIAGFHAIST